VKWLLSAMNGLIGRSSGTAGMVRIRSWAGNVRFRSGNDRRWEENGRSGPMPGRLALTPLRPFNSARSFAELLPIIWDAETLTCWVWH
jgi:hypothetical protein